MCQMAVLFCKFIGSRSQIKSSFQNKIRSQAELTCVNPIYADNKPFSCAKLWQIWTSTVCGPLCVKVKWIPKRIWSLYSDLCTTPYGHTPEVTSYVYQLWRHVTSYVHQLWRQSYGYGCVTQVWLRIWRMSEISRPCLFIWYFVHNIMPNLVFG